MDLQVAGLVALLAAIANLWAALSVASSEGAAIGKAAWLAVILLLPVAGLLLWVAAGPRASPRVG